MSLHGQPAGAGRRGAAAGGHPGRLGLAAALLALVAFGLRGELTAPALDGPFRHDGLPVGIVLEAVLACLMTALAIRHSRAPRDALVGARLRALLTYLVGIGLIAIPAAYLLSRLARTTLKPRPAPKNTGSAPRPAGLFHGAHGSVGGLVVTLILLALVAAAVIYAVAWFLRTHRWTWAGRRPRAPGLALPPEDEAGGGDLREAVESGRTALRLIEDARAAIIACYAAMEQSLASAGTARAAADTPGELLARAGAQGLIRTAAAARLTALFCEARFSTHPVLPRQRDDAQQALADLAASLARPEPAAGAGR